MAAWRDATSITRPPSGAMPGSRSSSVRASSSARGSGSSGSWRCSRGSSSCTTTASGSSASTSRSASRRSSRSSSSAGRSPATSGGGCSPCSFAASIPARPAPSGSSSAWQRSWPHCSWRCASPGSRRARSPSAARSPRSSSTMVPNNVALNVAVIPLREPAAVDLRARLRAGVTPLDIQELFEQEVTTPVRGDPQITLEELDGEGRGLVVYSGDIAEKTPRPAMRRRRDRAAPSRRTRTGRARRPPRSSTPSTR